MIVLYGAPLWPAGHLPHKGGDQLSPASASHLLLAKAAVTANLPPRGGDVRQDRGGREGMRASA
jgi:hypothetical protein